MPDIFEKDSEGNLKITPASVQPESVVITRSKAEQELSDAEKIVEKIEADLISAKENVAQKQNLISECDKLGIK